MINRKSLRKPVIAPDWLNQFLLAVNINRFFLAMRPMKKYREFLKDNNEKYDNSQRLLDMVNYAISHIPYYQNLYKERISSVDEFQEKIGFINKEMIMDNHEQFILPNLNSSNYDIVTTGGTSKKPLQMVTPKDRYIFEFSTLFQLWANTGFRNQTRAVIRNHRLPSDKDWAINPVLNELIFDGFRLTPDYYEVIYNTIRKKQIRYIHCYPSTAYEFGKFLYYNKKDTSFIRAFLSGSENIFDSYKTMIRDNLGIPFYNWYGHSEKLVLGGYCRGSENYHIEPTYGCFELIDEDGIPVTETGKTGEIVGTTLNNRFMPLLRYRTGDFAEFAGDFCPHCRRHLPLIKNIRGRWSGERVYHHDMSFVTTTALNLHDELYQVIDGIQYVQDEPGRLKILIIKSPVYTETHQNKILNHFRSTMNPGSEIEIEYVDQLIRQPNGKFLLLISNVKPNNASNQHE